jgi:hypothetical protein
MRLRSRTRKFSVIASGNRKGRRKGKLFIQSATGKDEVLPVLLYVGDFNPDVAINKDAGDYFACVFFQKSLEYFYLSQCDSVSSLGPWSHWNSWARGKVPN